MDATIVRNFIEKTILEESKPILNLRYLDMEKFRKFVLIQLDRFLDEQTKNQNNSVILSMKRDTLEDDKIDVSVCGDIINDNTQKSAYVKIKGKQIHWSDAALMDSNKLTRLVRRYNREHPNHKIPRHKQNSSNDVIHHIWKIKFDM